MFFFRKSKNLQHRVIGRFRNIFLLLILESYNEHFVQSQILMIIAKNA
jgi:hypothetical protein